MKKIFLIIYGTALFMLTMAFLLTSNYKDYRFYITLIILLAICGVDIMMEMKSQNVVRKNAVSCITTRTVRM